MATYDYVGDTDLLYILTKLKGVLDGTGLAPGRMRKNTRLRARERRTRVCRCPDMCRRKQERD